ncbi:MAG: hypothetical protein B7Y31_04760 [Novosphingobium sp. 16-62-11]|nr:MAG: hypothetical protein B7Y31_04760 [Novosphingobium sp. 16-62-11]
MDMSFEHSAAWAQDDPAFEAAFGLRPLTWHGLCAQITAMQDLRRAFVRGPAQGNVGTIGSFDAGTARLIATGFSGGPAQMETYECPVNPNSSVNGKALLARTVDAITGVWTDHAEVRD